MLKEKLIESIKSIKEKCDLKPRIGITLGSGLSSFASSVAAEATIPYDEIPHFSPPTVDGHPGQLILGTIGPVPVAVLQGRTHFYEGHSMEQVVYPTRVLAYLGIETLVLTNASGGIDPTMQPGDFMIIEDHINLTGDNPLIGANTTELGPRFPDMSEPYDRELNLLLKEVLEKRKVRHHKGIYCGVSGPTYETAAEVKFLQTIGGRAVGMSTVPETIAAKHMGLRVCGLCCITNLATGLSSEKLSHEDVKEVGMSVEKDFCATLTEFIEKL